MAAGFTPAMKFSSNFRGDLAATFALSFHAVTSHFFLVHCACQCDISKGDVMVGTIGAIIWSRCRLRCRQKGNKEVPWKSEELEREESLAIVEESRKKKTNSQVLTCFLFSFSISLFRFLILGSGLLDIPLFRTQTENIPTTRGPPKE